MITTFVRLHLGAPRPHGATPSCVAALICAIGICLAAAPGTTSPTCQAGHYCSKDINRILHAQLLIDCSYCYPQYAQPL
jgi:hypothetical protein